MKLTINSSRVEFVFPNGAVWEVGLPYTDFFQPCTGEDVRITNSTYKVVAVVNVFENDTQSVRIILQ